MRDWAIRSQAPKGGFTYGEGSETKWQWAAVGSAPTELKIESGPRESGPWEERPNQPGAQGTSVRLAPLEGPTEVNLRKDH